MNVCAAPPVDFFWEVKTMDGTESLDRNAWQNKVRIGHHPEKGKCLRAVEFIRAGSVIGYCEGEEVSEDTVYTYNLGGVKLDTAEPFRYASHSCQPNAQFKDKGRWLYAIADIHAGDEITTDYLYTEAIISAPFICKCGAANCRGYICTPNPSDGDTL
jgi:hypothetical protein